MPDSRSSEKSAYEPTQGVKRKAEAAGIDLDALRRSDPTTYAMLNAERTVQVSPQLKEVAGEALFATFPERQIFDMPYKVTRGNELLSLLIFPPLDRAELERLDKTLAALATQAPLEAGNVFYRVVSDTAGEHREFALPISPSDWQGQADVMIGPFVSEAAAKTWSEARIDASSGLVSDALPYNDAWFCDLFRGDSA